MYICGSSRLTGTVFESCATTPLNTGSDVTEWIGVALVLFCNIFYFLRTIRITDQISSNEICWLTVRLVPPCRHASYVNTAKLILSFMLRLI